MPIERDGKVWLSASEIAMAFGCLSTSVSKVRQHGHLTDFIALPNTYGGKPITKYYYEINQAMAWGEAYAARRGKRVQKLIDEYLAFAAKRENATK